MDENKYVTLEMFEQYHKKLMEYIGMHDDLMLDGFTICPKCGATITSDKCENCVKESEAKSMIEVVRCPKCGSTSFDCYDTDCNIENTIHWNLCYCDDCDYQFSIKYIAIEID